MLKCFFVTLKCFFATLHFNSPFHTPLTPSAGKKITILFSFALSTKNNGF
jgi:hypothetical protein